MTTEDRGEQGCYVGIDGDGIVVSVCVDNPEHRKDVAKFCADAVKDGLTLGRCKARDLWDKRVELYKPMPKPSVSYEPIN